ncbi:MAG TPA: hypothetical protein VKV32_11940 [Stellaceae bacterium]|nr:hypothetical protein [Stellaceae bacterium]
MARVGWTAGLGGILFLLFCLIGPKAPAQSLRDPQAVAAAQARLAALRADPAASSYDLVAALTVLGDAEANASITNFDIVDDPAPAIATYNDVLAGSGDSDQA